MQAAIRHSHSSDWAGGSCPVARRVRNPLHRLKTPYICWVQSQRSLRSSNRTCRCGTTEASQCRAQLSSHATFSLVRTPRASRQKQSLRRQWVCSLPIDWLWRTPRGSPFPQHRNQAVPPCRRARIELQPTSRHEWLRARRAILQRFAFASSSALPRGCLAFYSASFTTSPFSATPDMRKPTWHS